MEEELNQQYLLKLAQMRMPFGKYKGKFLIDLKEDYFIWFARNGYPKGELGHMMQSIYEIKLNGLENLLRPLKGLRK